MANDETHAEATSAAASEADETAINSDIGLTKAIDTAAASLSNEPGSAHAWSLDDHGEESEAESKWPGRLRWAGLIALLCATVAAVVWFSMVYYFAGRSIPKVSPPTTTNPTTTSRPAVASASAAPSPGIFSASAVDTVLLTPVEINTLVSSSDPLLQIKQTTYGMRNDANLVHPPACVGTVFTGEHAVFDSTGFSAMHDETLEQPGGYTTNSGPIHVEQTVVVYPTPQQATTVLTSSQHQWESCAKGRVRLGTVGQNGENGLTFELGTVQRRDDVLTVPMIANSQESGGAACQQAMAARNNVLVGVRSCRNPEPPPGQLDANIGSVRDDAEQLAGAMLDKIAPVPSPPPASSPSTKPSASGLPSGAASGLACNAGNAAKLAYDPKNGKEIVCVNQALTPDSPPSWQWAEPPPMTTGLNATGAQCNTQAPQIMSRSSDGYLIVCQSESRSGRGVGYWQHYLGPIE